MHICIFVYPVLLLYRKLFMDVLLRLGTIALIKGVGLRTENYAELTSHVRTEL